MGHYDVTGGYWWDRDIRLGGRMIAQSAPSDTYFLHANNLGSDTQVTDHSGAVKTDFVYYPWEMGTSVGTVVDAHFAGFQQSAGPTYGTPTRTYSGPQGRWFSPDPIGKAASRLDDPQTWNMYAYVRNNPTTLTDPTGLDVELANDTEEGRKRALAKLKETMSSSEAANIGYRKTMGGQYELYVKGAKAVNLSKASAGYKDLVGLIADHSIVANYGLVGGGLTATFPSLGQVGSYSNWAFTSPDGGKNVNVIVTQGDLPGGVRVYGPSGGETTGRGPDYMTAAHELFGETLKYRAGYGYLQGDPMLDSSVVIGIENDIRRDLGLPLRTGSDHGNVYEVQ